MIEKIIERLQAGEVIENYKESGNSMTPIIKHRQPITIAPVDTHKVTEGDIVLVKVKGRIYTHLVHATNMDRVLIGNNHGRVNGWAARRNIFGIVTHVDGRERASAREKVLNESQATE